jgi:hypothetical protein
MRILEQHVSPDGLLKFAVGREEDGDTYLGFLGIGWHTHGDMLSASTGLPEGQAIQQFVDRLVGSRTIVAVMRIGGQVCDMWTTDDPDADMKGLLSDETLELRYWDGSRPS